LGITNGLDINESPQPQKGIPEMAGTWNRSEAIRQRLGVVIFDSALHSSMAASRGGRTGASRQCVIRVAEFDIHIMIWESGDDRKMQGRMASREGGAAPAGARFHLLQHGERIDSTVIDEMGNFIFAEVPEGELSLQIDLPNLTIVGALNIKEC
jgi:hypothetical protein